jgi:hypothetical protein
MVTERPPEITSTDDPARASRPRFVPPALWVAALYAITAGIYLVLAHRSVLPTLYPDELRYGHLARSLAGGHGFDWHGSDFGLSAAFYVYFITPVWALFDSSVDAYAWTKTLGTLALCAQLIPVWFLARDLVGPRLALVPAGLSVAGTWMLSSAETATESLAFPLATAGLCVGVLALRRPGSRLGWLAFGFIVLAAWARIQVAVLIPALAAAYLIDVVRDPAHREARLRAHRPYLIGFVGISAMLALVTVAAPSLTGAYSGFFDYRPPLGRIMSRTGLQMLELVVLSGFIPLLLVAGATATSAAWRDDRTGPLLAVFWTATLATVIESGVFLAGYEGVPTGIQRYVSYTVPVAFVLCTVLLLDARLLPRRSFVVAAGLGFTLLAMPHTALIAIERAVWATGYRVNGLTGLGSVVGMAVAGVSLIGVVWVIRNRAGRPLVAMLATSTLLLGVLLVQDQASWQYLIRMTTNLRAQYPADLRWLDHNSRGGVARLGITVNAPLFVNVDYFNRNVTRVYQPAGGLPGHVPEGRLCTWAPQPTGEIDFEAACGPAPHRFWIDDPWARVTFQDEVSSVSDPALGRIVEVDPTSSPRLQSMIILPCPPHLTPSYSETSPHIPGADDPFDCRPELAGRLWLAQKGELILRFQGGTADQTLSAGPQQQAWAIPAGRLTSIRLAAPQGASQFRFLTDWTTNIGAPRVKAIELVAAGRTTQLLS